jgi:hypothetical protein
LSSVAGGKRIIEVLIKPQKDKEGTMKAINRILLSLVLLLVFEASGIAAQPEVPLVFADLGDFRLESDQVIRNCRLGYRTAGVLNKEKSNVILFPTWLAGTSKDLFYLEVLCHRR